jgi:hypothetical protein
MLKSELSISRRSSFFKNVSRQMSCHFSNMYNGDQLLFKFVGCLVSFLESLSSHQIIIKHVSCYDLIEFNSGCNLRQRLEGDKGR